MSNSEDAPLMIISRQQAAASHCLPFPSQSAPNRSILHPIVRSRTSCQLLLEITRCRVPQPPRLSAAQLCVIEGIAPIVEHHALTSLTRHIKRNIISPSLGTAE